MANKRIFYPTHQIGFSPTGSTLVEEAHGVQSVGINTSFEVERINELGQVNTYENIEAIPRVEITAEKVLDGYPLLYHLATSGAPRSTLVGRSAVQCVFWMSVFDDTLDSASGTPITQMQSSGAQINSLTYTAQTEGNCTESVTLVSNHKAWATGSFVFSGAFPTNDDQPLALPNSGGVQRREDVIFEPAVGATTGTNGMVTTLGKCTVLPRNLYGVTSSGTNVWVSGEEYWLTPIQSMNVSVDLNRQELLELGLKRPYYRFANFPVDVTTEIEMTDIGSDGVECTISGVYGDGNNTRDESIRLRFREGTFVDCGDKNRLTSVNRTGGDATGGNATITYTYINNSFMTVTHPQDPTVGLRVF